MCFGGDIRARQLEHSVGGLLGQGYCVERLSLLKVETVETHKFFMLMRDNLHFAISKKASSMDYVYLTVFRLSLCIQQPE